MAPKLENLLPTLAKMTAERGRRRSLADLAEEIQTSASTLQRAFSRVVGESPKQYSRRLQLEQATGALIGSTRSVLEIALEAGFESHEGFTRAFAAHFGVPPKVFRDRQRRLREAPLHAELVEQVGPCIGLIRAPLDTNHSREDRTMSYEIARQPIDSINFLFRKERCRHDEIAEILGKLFPAVFQYAVQNGIELRSPPTAVYHDWGPGSVTVHAGMAVGGAEEDGDLGGEMGDGVELVTLPAGQAAVTIHSGPYEGLGDAHAAIDRFLDENGLESADAPREIYLTDPGEVPDPKDWKTQVIRPIRA